MVLGLVNLELALISYAIWVGSKREGWLFSCGFCLAAGLYIIMSELIVLIMSELIVQ